jgi:hypothetical protein
MARFIPFVVGLGLLLGSELLHGHWTNRWRLSNEPQASCAKLPRQDEPMIVGDWKGHPSPPLQDQDIIIGEIAGYFHQVFVHPRGYAVQVLVVCGRPGPIAVHTPEVCLGGEGFIQEDAKQRHSVRLAPPDQPVEFWVGQFYRYDGGLRRDQRQYWTYSTDGLSWTADDNPRFHFARCPALYKIYIMRQLSRKDEKLEEDPTIDFIKLFMPEMQKRLSATPSRL